MENTVYDIGGGWKARRDREGMPEALHLYRHGRSVYVTDIPPKMTEEALLHLAQTLARVYDAAWSAGWEECRYVILDAAAKATETA